MTMMGLIRYRENNKENEVHRRLSKSKMKRKPVKTTATATTPNQQQQAQVAIVGQQQQQQRINSSRRKKKTTTENVAAVAFTNNSCCTFTSKTTQDDHVDIVVNSNDNDDSIHTVATLPLEDDEEEEDRRRSSNTRVVSFADSFGIHDVLRRKDYTKQERRETWYSRKEFLEIRMHVKTLCELLEALPGICDEDDDIIVECRRGLERRGADDKDTNSKRYKRSRAVQAVLNEIQYQHRQGYTNTHMIADVYREYSIPCLAAAHVIGKQDELYVLLEDL